MSAIVTSNALGLSHALFGAGLVCWRKERLRKPESKGLDGWQEAAECSRMLYLTKLSIFYFEDREEPAAVAVTVAGRFLRIIGISEC
jgi:hypothetical protein